MPKKKKYSKEELSEALDAIYDGNFDYKAESERVNDLIRTLSESVQSHAQKTNMMFDELKPNFDRELFLAIDSNSAIDIKSSDLAEAISDSFESHDDFANKFEVNFEKQYMMPVDAFVGYDSYVREFRATAEEEGISALESKLDYSKPVKSKQKMQESEKMFDLPDDEKNINQEVEPTSEPHILDEVDVFDEADGINPNQKKRSKSKDYELEL